jgi:hypothetical protein
MSFKLVRIQERLSFLGKLLTKPGVDQELSHYDRQRLLEEAEELTLVEKEGKEEVYAPHGGRV